MLKLMQHNYYTLLILATFSLVSQLAIPLNRIVFVMNKWLTHILSFWCCRFPIFTSFFAEQR